MNMRFLWKNARATISDMPSGDGISMHTVTNFLHVFDQCREVTLQVCPHILADIPEDFDQTHFALWILSPKPLSRFVFDEGDWLTYCLILAMYEFALDTEVPPARPITLHITASLAHWDLDEDEMEQLDSILPRVFMNRSRNCLFRLHASFRNRLDGVTADLIPW